ncbi:hypothetical protein MRB53_006502 [Persea americana]|uniref:Uncharacterized protein n=1 Tax=Persea americana TaxID=3435 RepID=A0ACC2MGB1_PERAE|nr:hypothetical protein MRB53_006502 [Persea americana]
MIEQTLILLRSVYSCYSIATAPPPLGIRYLVLHASTVFVVNLGLLSMTVDLVIPVPTIFFMWVTVIIFLAFASRPLHLLMTTAKDYHDEDGIKEGNLVLAACVILSYLALTRREDD